MSQTHDASRGEVTRARLLAAATTAFAEKGFHGTTTRDIAQAAGMSPAALYVHHRSKEELLHLISREGHLTTLRLVREAVASTEDPALALRRLVHDFAIHHAEGHTGARIVNQELAALSPEHLVEIRGIRDEIDSEVRRLVDRGVAAGRFDVADSRLAAAALLSLGIDLARWYREDVRWSPEQIAERYAEMALRLVGSAAGPA
ncbi:TetR/AcrR family transcriptional regulator [Nocardioides mangrovicus]|uniref:TetR/AcrR family transcriptional regulator n=1 Tax=Nocardioides mangrovicus TaxID=2478913 RepID=A0A3L8NXW1_9ACTN|nr:TetR/AcrR family transcriptional regulator [Nocardioides mangrovicus]RLV47764.1 TetR/AcrR family transcriptional regulator [Nocardioides mangrovicus]